MSAIATCDKVIKHLVGADVVEPFIVHLTKDKLKVLNVSGGTIQFFIKRNKADTAAVISKTSATPGEIDLDFVDAAVGDITITDADLAALELAVPGSIGKEHFFGLWYEDAAGLRTPLAEGRYLPCSSTEDFP